VNPTAFPRVGHLREPEATLRASGALLGIFDLPAAPSDTFTLARFVVPAGLASTPDTHEVREMWVILRGEGRLKLDGEETRVRAGEVLYFDSLQTHQLINEGEEAVELLSMWWRP
jgi:mannose-6-phosphate isomerase-like protein (cupin superfamily)